MNKDIINILREVRGTAKPGDPLTDGIWYELTVQDTNGNAGIYGDILAKHTAIGDNAPTLEQAVAILENLNVEVTTLPAGSQATSELDENDVWQIGIPQGSDGLDGADGNSPVVSFAYNATSKQLEATVDGDTSDIVNLDQLVDDAVTANIAVQQVQADAAQVALDKIAVEGIRDTFDANVTTKTGEFDTHVEDKKTEFDGHIAGADAAFDANAATKTGEYNTNHTTKLSEYNNNDTTKTAAYDLNHATKLGLLNDTYADRAEDIIQVGGLLGAAYPHTATVSDTVIEFPSTSASTYLYYKDGDLWTEGMDYALGGDNKSLTLLGGPLTDGDVVTQIDTAFLNQILVDIGTTDVNVQEIANYAALPGTGVMNVLYVVLVDETNDNETVLYTWTSGVYRKVANEFTDAAKAKLAGVEVGATADQTDSEIETAYNNQVPIVSQIDAEAGTSTAAFRWSPERVQQAISAGSTKVKIADTPPAGASAGDLWYDSTSAILYVFYSDGSDEAWLDVSGNDAGISEFIELNDVPSAYTGQSGNALIVKAGEDGLEFFDVIDQDNMVDGTVNKNYTVTEQVKLGYITITGAVDLDALDGDSHTHTNKANLDTINQELRTDSDVVFSTVNGRDITNDGTKLDTVEPNATADQNASEVPYTNGVSGLVATDTQSAIDEVEARVEVLENEVIQGTFNASNDEPVATDVTGLVFDGTAVRTFSVDLVVEIDATANFYEFMSLRGVYNAASGWSMSVTSVGDDSEIDFTVSTAGSIGQIRYTSSNQAGFVSSVFKWNSETIAV